MRKVQVCSAEMSRRTLLHGVACAAAGAAPILGVTVTAERALAQAKMSQAAAGYQGSPKGSQRCDNCSLFQPPNACKTVAGTISPSGWCKLYVQKRG